MMSDLHEDLPAKPWLAMNQAEREAAHEQLLHAFELAFQHMLDDINAELGDRGCPLQARGHVTIAWEERRE